MSVSKSALGKVRDIAVKSDDERARLHALEILTAGASLFDVDGPRGDEERELVRAFQAAGCTSEYAFCDERGPVVTTARGWYHVVTCEGARPCYKPADWCE